MSKAHFGDIPDVPVGTVFRSRHEAAESGIHRPLIAGICGPATIGAESIVVNGGYVDDLDLGNEIVYTGAGGNDTSSKRQIAHQSFDHTPNAALVTSQELDLPVRVIRGFRGDPQFSPQSGYRYDGLFKVVEHWSEIGKDGFRICRFRLTNMR